MKILIYKNKGPVHFELVFLLSIFRVGDFIDFSKKMVEIKLGFISSKEISVGL
jgi:hypothetical protein